MHVMSRVCALIFLISPLAMGCGDEPLEETTAGSADQGTTDQGTTDQGTTDQGTTDQGTTDQGTTTGDGVCVPGDKYCQGDVLFICNIEGTGYNQTTCPFGCVDADGIAACNQGCQQQAPTCKDQLKLETCNADGTLTVTDCDYACKDGECIDPPQVCEPGNVFCEPSGKTLLTCSDDGTEVSESVPCPYGCGGDTPACLEAACQPDETRCSPDDANLIELCMEDQTGWVAVNESCKDGCEDGQCVVLACEPNSQSCGPLGVMECTADGKELNLKKPCKTECIEDGDGVTCAKCIEGTTQCNGNTVETCVDKSVGFESSEECSQLQACANNACIDVLVLNDANGNGGNYLLIAKAFVDCFNKGVEGVCRPIDTVSMTTVIEGKQLINWFCDEEKVTPNLFDSQEQYDTAKDIMGCGSIFSPNVDDFQIDGGKIVPSQDSEQCIGYSKGFDVWDAADLNWKEVIVQSCEKFEKE